jgi:hypothetical protein
MKFKLLVAVDLDRESSRLLECESSKEELHAGLKHDFATSSIDTFFRMAVEPML